jgi:CDGSH-type Zn-finger protein
VAVPVTLTFTENGCIIVESEGRVVIRRDGRDEVVERPRIALCRCGHSESKPYCDSTHRRAGFVAPPASIEIGVLPD